MKIVKELSIFTGFVIAAFSINYLFALTEELPIKIKEVHPYMCELACLDGNHHMSEDFRTKYCSFKSVNCYHQSRCGKARHPSLATAKEVNNSTCYFVIKKGLKI